jgi:hypothetical protein
LIFLIFNFVELNWFGYLDFVHWILYPWHGMIWCLYDIPAYVFISMKHRLWHADTGNNLVTY